MRAAAYLFLFLSFTAFANCSSLTAIPAEEPGDSGAPRPHAGPLPVRYGSVPSAQYLRTACRSNNQSTYVRNVIETTLDNGTLSILFPMNPAFHLTVAIEVKDGRYTLMLRRVPLQSGYRIEHTVKNVSLVLDKQRYTVGDVLYGHLELAFSESTFRQRGPNAGSGETDATLDTSPHYFTGPFSAIVRPAGFDPQADESIAAYTDLAMAMQVAIFPRRRVRGDTPAGNRLLARASGYLRPLVCGRRPDPV